jgi:hypothetical protein
MNITITITDSTSLLALQRALDAQNATRSTPLTTTEFVQGMVSDQCAGLAAQHLVARITPFDFLNRFTAAERATIRTAALANGTIADYVAMVGAAPAVVLTDELTTTGVNSLETAGLIAAGRAAQILAL